MGRDILLACLPWAGLLLASFAGLYLLVRASRLRPDWSRLARVHRDERGAVQSLSFVLTLPIFIMILMLIVQVSQLMIGSIVVHYAAFATVRSASVWIPAMLSEEEDENCISSFSIDPDAPEQVAPILRPGDPRFGPREGGLTFIIHPGSPKYEKIRSAAWLACMPICPSRDLGLDMPPEGSVAADVVKRLYASMVPSSDQNPRTGRRIENKLAYAMANTDVELRFFHTNREPPLTVCWRLHGDLLKDFNEFRLNELGFQDPISATVYHRMALLPGPGRLLAREVPSRDGSPDEVAQTIGRSGSVYVYPLEASATMCIEGEKSVIPYGYDVY